MAYNAQNKTGARGGYLCQGIDIAPDRQGFSAYAETRPARIRKTDVEYR